VTGCASLRAVRISGNHCATAIKAGSQPATEEHSIVPGLDVMVEEPKQDRTWALKLQLNTSWVWAALVVLLSVWILRIFLEPLLWAAVVAIASWPIYRRFARSLPGWMASSVTPLLFTALVSVFVLGPIVFAFGTLIAQAQRWVNQVALADQTGLAVPAWLEDLPLVGTWLAERWQALFGTPGGLSVWLQRADASAVLGWAETLGQFMAHHLLVISFTLLVLFFLYRRGDALPRNLSRLVHDRLGPRAQPYVELAIVALRATVNGMVILGLFDGILTGISYALAGVERAEAWGAVTGVLSLIPFLAYAVVAAVALTLLAKGALMAAVTVAALGVVVLFAGDKIVRPLLVGSSAKLGFVWVLMGTLGGVELLGLLGLFVGPVVLALGGALWQEWTRSQAQSRTAGVTVTVTHHA
jgi:predicted PurR-regulated permease PerM